MSKLLQVKIPKPGLFFASWLVAANLFEVLILTTHLWVWQGLLFLCLVFLPGTVLLRILRLKLGYVVTDILYSFGLSVLVLMLSGLAANQILFALGLHRPLDLPGALVVWDVFTALLIAVGTFVNRRPIEFKIEALFGLPRAAWLFIILSLLLPCLAVLGAFRLNNGLNGMLAEFTLIYAAGLIIYAILLRRQLPYGLLAWFVFILGLTILLMTALRGWDIVGHDIEAEFRVYALTSNYGHWDVSLYRNPYNACLSITILPQMFASLMGVSGLVVFKVILQVIFAVCPVAIFVVLRRFVPKLGTLVGCLLFLCYPTFINDSAMLTRQGVAYLFFALALILVVQQVTQKRYKLLFLLCALGTVLSHYSTSYMFVSLFAGAVLCKLSLYWWQTHRGQTVRHIKNKTVLTPLFALILFSMTFMWYTQITATSGGLVETMRKSFASIPQIFSSDNKSSDTSGAIFSSGVKTQTQLYQSYLSSSKVGELPAQQYSPVLVSDDLPLTNIGHAAAVIGINPDFINQWRQSFAKFLQLFALVAVFYMIYRLLRSKMEVLAFDYTCVCLAGIILLGLIIVLPVISINYGILRAFQQGLIFLLLPMTIVLMRLFQNLRPRLGTFVLTSATVVIFLLFTGVFAQILGGVSPSLSMNNLGLYWGLYYSPKADLQAFKWLQQHISKKNDVRVANLSKAFMHNPDFPFLGSGILPSQIGPGTFVYLDQSQVIRQRLYTYYQGSALIMTFPLDFYDNAKNEIYSTTSTRIYR